MRKVVAAVIGASALGALVYAWPRPPAVVTSSSHASEATAATSAVETHAAKRVEYTRSATPPRGPADGPPAPAELPPDIAARWKAIEVAVRDGALDQLPALEAAELAKEPEAAPAIIHGVASLAAQGSESDRAEAGRTLARWLREESKRDTRDAQGNVVNLVEALGDLGGDDAVTALIWILDGAGSADDLALQTTACSRLAALDDKRALPAVTRFGERVAKSAEPADDFERELRAEAVQAASDAVTRLTGHD